MAETLPQIRDIEIAQGETKRLVSDAFGTWIISDVHMTVRARTGAADVIFECRAEEGGFTIGTREGYDGSYVEFTMDDSQSSELPPGEWVYDIFITLDSQPKKWRKGKFIVDGSVTRDGD